MVIRGGLFLYIPYWIIEETTQKEILMPDWKKIKAEYIRGGTSYRKLANKYGVSFSALRRLAAKEKWTDLRTQSGHKANAKMVENIASQEAKRVDMFSTIADMLLQQIYNDVQQGKVLLTGKGTYRDVTGAIKDLKEIKGYKSELDIKEQIARIEKLRKEATVQDNASEIKVTISPELENFGQ